MTDKQLQHATDIIVQALQHAYKTSALATDRQNFSAVGRLLYTNKIQLAINNHKE